MVTEGFEIAQLAIHALFATLLLLFAKLNIFALLSKFCNATGAYPLIMT